MKNGADCETIFQFFCKLFKVVSCSTGNVYKTTTLTFLSRLVIGHLCHKSMSRRQEHCFTLCSSGQLPTTPFPFILLLMGEIICESQRFYTNLIVT